MRPGMMLRFAIEGDFDGTHPMVSFAGAAYTFDAAAGNWPARREGGNCRVRLVLVR